MITGPPNARSLVPEPDEMVLVRMVVRMFVRMFVRMPVVVERRAGMALVVDVHTSKPLLGVSRYGNVSR